MNVQIRELRGASDSRESVTAYVAATRPRHWLKTALVYLPQVAVHRLYEPLLLWRGLGAFVAFSLCASSIYLFNDLRYVAADRAHPHNRSRPLASVRITEAGTLN